MNDIAVGNVVYLRGFAHIKMTVNHLQIMDSTWATCIWFDKNSILREHIFNVSSLVTYE